jgi:nitroreductase
MYVAKYIEHIVEVRSISREDLAAFESRLDGFVEESAGSAVGMGNPTGLYRAGRFLATAANLGIDACPMEGFLPPLFDEILQLDRQQLRSVAIAAAGYRAADDPFAGLKKVRFGISDLFVRV